MQLRTVGLIALMLVSATASQAATITYEFTGVASGSMGALGFVDNAFSVTLTGDTGNITQGGTERFNQVGSATFDVGGVTGNLTGFYNEAIVNNDPGFPAVVFGQSNATSGFVAEGLINSVFVPYDLAHSFPLTGGSVSFAVQTFETSLGGLYGNVLTFDSISSMDFQAIGGGIPEASTWAMMLVGFAGVGVAGFARAKSRRAAA